MLWIRANHMLRTRANHTLRMRANHTLRAGTNHTHRILTPDTCRSSYLNINIVPWSSMPCFKKCYQYDLNLRCHIGFRWGCHWVTSERLNSISGSASLERAGFSLENAMWKGFWDVEGWIVHLLSWWVKTEQVSKMAGGGAWSALWWHIIIYMSLVSMTRASKVNNITTCEET